MAECKNCEFYGYSQDVCHAHRRKCSSAKPKQDVADDKNRLAKPLKKAPHYGMKALVGVGAGALAVAGTVTVAPIVGLHFLAHALAVKVSAGVVGGGVGFWSYKGGKKKLGEKGVTQ